MYKIIALFLILLSPLSFSKTCETKRVIFFENAETKVWKTTLCPKTKLPFHSHQYARVLIPEESGSLKVIYESGKEKLISFQKKTPIFLSLEQGKEAHQDENTGNQALHLTLIELKHG